MYIKAELEVLVFKMLLQPRDNTSTPMQERFEILEQIFLLFLRAACNFREWSEPIFVPSNIIRINA